MLDIYAVQREIAMQNAVRSEQLKQVAFVAARGIIPSARIVESRYGSVLVVRVTGVKKGSSFEPIFSGINGQRLPARCEPQGTSVTAVATRLCNVNVDNSPLGSVSTPIPRTNQDFSRNIWKYAPTPITANPGAAVNCLQNNNYPGCENAPAWMNAYTAVTWADQPQP